MMQPAHVDGTGAASSFNMCLARNMKGSHWLKVTVMMPSLSLQLVHFVKNILVYKSFQLLRHHLINHQGPK